MGTTGGTRDPKHLEDVTSLYWEGDWLLRQGAAMWAWCICPPPLFLFWAIVGSGGDSTCGVWRCGGAPNGKAVCSRALRAGTAPLLGDLSSPILGALFPLRFRPAGGAYPPPQMEITFLFLLFWSDLGFSQGSTRETE